MAYQETIAVSKRGVPLRLRTPAKPEVVFEDDEQRLKRWMRALSKKYAWEIVADLCDGSKNLTQLSEDNSIPYTTVQNRVAEMERAGLVHVWEEISLSTGRPVKKTRVENFVLDVTPQRIKEIVLKERGRMPGFLR